MTRQRNIVTGTIWTPDLTHFPGPKYLALSRALREAVRAGTLAEGSQLPTVRDLAWALGVTPGTVSRAYALATQEGLLAATVGRGTFVAARTPRLGPTQPLFVEREPQYLQGRADLRAPQLPDVGQGEAFRAALAAVADTVGPEWIDYPSQRAEAPLRAAIVDWVSDRVLGAVGPDDIALTAGGQNAISLIFLCCLRGDRPVVLTEELSYPGFRHAARLARADVVGVETDAEGLIPDALEAACLERRQRIAAIARHFDLQVIEDDCYSLTDSSLPSLRALAPERVWHVGSLSKTVSAALRFGYVVCPSGMGETGRLTAQHAYFALAKPVSDIALHLFSSGAAADLRRRAAADLDARLVLTVQHLGRFDLVWQPGLRFVFLRLPQGWRASTFTREAEGEGVLLRSADEYTLIHGRAPQAVRLALAGNVPMARFEAGLRSLARLLDRPPYDPPAV
jgi:DNA-binding transcriptional MocR family regulator